MIDTQPPTPLSALQAAANQAPFALTIDGLPQALYGVHRWQLSARLDEPYCLSVVLHLQSASAAPFAPASSASLLRRHALFELQAQAATFEPVHGAIAAIEFGVDTLAPGGPRTGTLQSDVLPCTLTIRPRLWWASLAQASRSRQRQTTEEAVRSVLALHGLSAQDIDFRLSTPLTARRYRQQFEETNLAYVQRLLEREGLAFLFEQTANREVLVATDDAPGYARPPQWSGVRCVTEAGLATPPDDALGPYLSGWNQVITTFTASYQVVPTEHSVDDYNYRSASVGLSSVREGTAAPFGRIDTYGLGTKTPEEAQLRVRQQAERYAQHALRAEATSTLTALSPGQCIGIAAGPSYALGRWLVLSVESSGDRRTPYANRFTAQPETTPYRPEWDTPLPKMAGVTHMRLDTSQPDNPYARLDPHGRYLAWHYFEHGQSQNGTGSAPLRLARDHAGPTYGQHFPVHAGVEALAGYIHGDADRPILLAVVHDSANPNHVTSANASRHVLRTWANNKLRMDDETGQEHVKLSTEYGLSQLNLGQLVNQDRAPRGSGFELRTDHEAALRAQQGWLVSTTATNVRGDPNGEGHQLHLQPLLDQTAQVRPWADNRSLAATQVGLEAASSLPAADRFDQTLPGLQAPMQASVSEVGIAFSARKNLVFGAEQTQGFYSQGPITLTSALPLGVTARKGVRLHAENGGIRQVVSSGDFTTHVQNGDFTVLAKGAVMLESKSGVVRLQTKGGAYFVEVGPSGFRTNCAQIMNKAGVKIDYTGGAVSGDASASAGSAGALDYFGKMDVEDICIECLLKAQQAGSPFTVPA